MSNPAPQSAATRHALLAAVADIGPVLRASGPTSETSGHLAPEAVAALRQAGMFRLKLPREAGGTEADPVTEMLVLEELAWHDLTSAWCTMVGATAVASLGMFLDDAALARVFESGNIPTAAISFFPAGRARRAPGGYRVSGRWRFNSGIDHAEWVLGGTVVAADDDHDAPQVMFMAFPIAAVTRHDNWGGVTGLRGTGSSDFSVEELAVPGDLAFVWDMMRPAPLRGGDSYRFPPFAFVAKEHGSVAIGAARRALDEIIAIATTMQGAFRPSKLADRQVFQRFVAQSDLKLRAARALLHARYQHHYDGIAQGTLPDEAAVAELRAASVHATDIAMEVVSGAYHFAGNTGLHHPHVIGRLLRDVHTAGIHQVMSDTAYENHGRLLMGLPADPMA